ncbi:DNA invertase Pin-like site-specific DNA recombinase [Pedobacter sp. AK013]|uniref:recombinase family protein n=1 Tax=Pedobacter sp. AK013 TaxID=2723071 RepID=UPI00160C2919|nr:recombinase family protein [Pedobacter sp. AK013]MBB6240470.1 DNA invertase Pin-like site-specific DNA recombinase [Pedobacter sp. AK013]
MEEDKKLLIAVGYARIERFKDMRELDRQAERIYEFCKENGIKLRVVLSEQGEKSLSWQLLERIVDQQAGRINLVVVADMDVLSSDVGWLLLKQAEFENEYGVEIVSVKGSQLSVGKDGGMTMD